VNDHPLGPSAPLPLGHFAPLEAAIEAFFRRFAIEPSSLLVALSGGPDSTALTLALLPFRQKGYRLAAAHVNHQLRGEDSNEDERFARTLCESHGIPLHVVQAPPDPEAVRHRGLEAAAREIRYCSLQRIREERSAEYLLTAHHQRDQAETFLLRSIHGGGAASLRGILPVTPDRILRPLLFTPREEIENLLEELRISPRLDQSNENSRFARNRIRADILPLVESLNARAVANLAQAADQLREQQEVLRPLLDDARARWVERSDTESAFALGTTPGDSWIVRSILLGEIQRLEPEARDVSHADLVRLAESLPTLKRTSITRTLELARLGDRIVMRKRRD